MSKLYQYTLFIFIIFFISACVDSATVKNETQSAHSQPKIHIVDNTVLSAMSTEEKIVYSEQLFEQSQTEKPANKNNLLSRALAITSGILIDYHQAKLLRQLGSSPISANQYEQAQQLTHQLLSQISPSALSEEQKSEYLLTTSLLSLTQAQPKQARQQLNSEFNSIQSNTWSHYHQLRAMADFQLKHYQNAVKELIVRHGYLINETQKQSNQYLIWAYLNYVDNNASVLYPQNGNNNSEQTYAGWLDLARILRDKQDPKTLNHAINFWLQNHPNHQADRHFINAIIQARSDSVLKIKQMAVLLPLQGKLAKPSKAILEGILASHYQSPLSDNIQLRIYNTDEHADIWQTYQSAVDNGADFIIGPLSKTKLEALSQADRLAIPTLALNSLETTHTPTAPTTNTSEETIPKANNIVKPTINNISSSDKKPIEKTAITQNNINNTQDNNANEAKTTQLLFTENLFQFGLSPESTARMVAEKGHQDGHHYALVIVPETTWGKRMSKAFSHHWRKLGGIVVDTMAYQPKSHDFSDAIKSMLNIDQSQSRKKEVSRTIGRKLEFTPRRRQDIDMIFMAAFPKQAKQIPLQITYHHGETIPIYSTSHMVANYHNARQNIDMDGVNFADMPFLLDNTQEFTSQQNSYQRNLYQRLFAMGVDSYQLAPYIHYLYKNPTESFAGDTGQISIDSNGHIIRSLPWTHFDQGIIKLKNSSQNNASLY